MFLAKEFNNSVTSSPQPLRKVERAYVRCVIVCVCVIDCVRVFGEDCPRFLRDDAFLRGLVIRENEDIPPPPPFFFVLLVLCLQTREMRDYESSFPAFAFAAIIRFQRVDNSEVLYCLRCVRNGIVYVTLRVRVDYTLLCTVLMYATPL